MESGYQPINCCQTSSFIYDDYHSPLRSRSYRSGGTTQHIASAYYHDCACVFDEQNSKDLCAMAPDLLRWGDDLISDNADHDDKLCEDELIRVSESDDVRSRTTFKDKFTSSIVADTSYLCDFMC